MKVVFVYYAYENQGSELDLQAYTRAAHELGHEVIIYGKPRKKIPLNYSTNLSGVDAVIFVLEWTTQLQYGTLFDWVRLLSVVPRHRRVIIDCDGRYNDMIHIDGDYNHRTNLESTEWIHFCDTLADKICQPTPTPLRPNVRPFLFHVYDPTWENRLDFRCKDYSMVYLGHSKFRWHSMLRLLHVIEPIRDRFGRIAFFGHGWDKQPYWAAEMGIEDIYQTDPEYLQRLHIETVAPVPFKDVISTMNRGVVNPVVYRPLFEHLRLVTCRTFETIAAGTLPLFVLSSPNVIFPFGDLAMTLSLPSLNPQRLILDLFDRPHHFASAVELIRQEFAQNHSPQHRFIELLELIKS